VATAWRPSKRKPKKHVKQRTKQKTLNSTQKQQTTKNRSFSLGFRDGEKQLDQGKLERDGFFQ